MVQWEGTKQVGLAPGQTSGEVEGAYVERPAEYSTTGVYVVDTPEQVAQKKKILESKTATFASPEEYGREIEYMRSIGQPVAPRTEIYIAPPGLTPSQIHLLEEMPRASGAAIQRVPSPFELGRVGYTPGGILDVRQQQREYPTTPIDYSRTHVSELYTYPLFRGAEYVSRTAQRGVEWGIERFPAPEPLKEAGRGFSGMFTGLPEYFASGISGIEYAAREPEVFKKGIVPAFQLFGAGIASQAVERPYYSLGQVAGLVVMWRGLPSGKPSRIPITEKMFGTGKPPKAITEYNIMVSEGAASVKPVGLKLVGQEFHNIAVSERVPSQFRSQIYGEKTPVLSRMFGRPGGRQPKISIMGEQFHNIEVAERVPFKPGVPIAVRMFGKPREAPIGLVLSGQMIHNIAVSERVPSSYRVPSSAFQKMFGRGGYVKPYRPSTLDILLVRPQTTFRPTGREVRYIPSRLRSSYIPSVRGGGRLRIFAGPSISFKSAEGQSIAQVPATKHISMFRTRTITRAIVRAGVSSIQIPVESSITAQVPIQAYTQVQEQISKEIQRSRTRETSISRLRFEFRPPTKLKIPSTSPDTLFSPRKKRKGRRKGIKYPELAGIAAPRQIMKGFKLWAS